MPSIDIQKANDLLRDLQRNHSAFQIENFIIGNKESAYFKYQQCLREIEARLDTLEDKKRRLDAVAKPLSMLNCIRMYFDRLFRKQNYNEKIRLKIKALKILQRDYNETARETDAFLKLAIKYKRVIGAITDKKRAEFEALSWFNKAKKMIALDLLSERRVTQRTFEFIFSLPEDMRNNLLGEIKGGVNPVEMIDSIDQPIIELKKLSQ